MADTFEVWVSGGDGTIRIPLYKGDDQERARGMADALVRFAGSTTFDVGVSIVHDETPTPTPTPTGRTATQTSKVTPQTGGTHDRGRGQ